MTMTTNIRRSLATGLTAGLAAGTLVLGFGLAAPVAHASSPGPDTVTISPCVINPDSCTPKPNPAVPKGPGDLTIDPCATVTHGDCDSDPHPDGPGDLTTPTTDPDGPDKPDVPDADPATVVHTTATFTG